MGITLQQQAEHFLGAEIPPSEWDSVEEYAKRKLERIIEREGDYEGERQRPKYLARLIAETVKSSRFSRFTFELMALDKYADELIGTKKNSPCRNT